MTDEPRLVYCPMCRREHAPPVCDQQLEPLDEPRDTVKERAAEMGCEVIGNAQIAIDEPRPCRECGGAHHERECPQLDDEACRTREFVHRDAPREGLVKDGLGWRPMLKPKSDEPRWRPITMDEVKRQIATWGLVAPYVTPENAPILAAILTEVADIQKSEEYAMMQHTDPLKIQIRRSALALVRALRLSKEMLSNA